MNLREQRVLIACLVALSFALAAGCDRSSDNQCNTFSVEAGSFEALTWTLSQGDELCRHLGYDDYWGGLGDTTVMEGGNEVHYITRLTCCK